MKIHQNYIALLAAVGFSLLVFLANMFLQMPSGLLRMGFAAALYLVARDTLAGASIAQGPRALTNPARWILAFYLALYFGTFMLLVTWKSMAYLPTQLVGVAIGASLFGTLMAFLPNNKPYPYAHHFQTDPEEQVGRFRSLFYYVIPPLKIGIIWILVQASPQTIAYFFFYIILIGFNTPRFKRVTNGNALWAYFPMIVGYVILLALLWLGR